MDTLGINDDHLYCSTEERESGDHKTAINEDAARNYADHITVDFEDKDKGRLIYCSDGVIPESELYDSDDDEPISSVLDSKFIKGVEFKELGWPSYLSLSGIYGVVKTLLVLEYLGEKLAWALGITQPKYGYVLNAHKLEQEIAKELEAELEDITDVESGKVETLFSENNPPTQASRDEIGNNDTSNARSPTRHENDGDDANEEPRHRDVTLTSGEGDMMFEEDTTRDIGQTKQDIEASIDNLENEIRKVKLEADPDRAGDVEGNAPGSTSMIQDTESHGHDTETDTPQDPTAV